MYFYGFPTHGKAKHEGARSTSVIVVALFACPEGDGPQRGCLTTQPAIKAESAVLEAAPLLPGTHAIMISSMAMGIRLLATLKRSGQTEMVLRLESAPRRQKEPIQQR
ncbi:uncharacterized protein PSFLO_00678 [Pseudozyma flocculosa]|uniref:Uncharacterized protein n=1 Tax=Pseudozyma flocculosa TaxID=84751 RepID=A0A5C3EUR4_9BASI|nr:uncharacterized protein PSFLO_00678 [Pseudozyma flocculosa]